MVFNDCVCFRLGKTVRRVSKAYRQQISQYNLTHGQFFMMVAVMEQEGLLPSELAEKTCQDRATITGLLDRLEKDGWIERRADQGDRRSLRIFLTPHGRACKKEIQALFESTNQKFIDCFSKEEWSTMKNFLTRLDQFSQQE